jgi:hypothetical protein
MKAGDYFARNVLLLVHQLPKNARGVVGKVPPDHFSFTIQICEAQCKKQAHI